MPTCYMCRASLQTAGMPRRHRRLTHGDSRDRAYGITALAARSEPAVTRSTNETVLVCRPRFLSDGRDNDSTSEAGSSETDSDSPSLGDNDHNAELPPLTHPRGSSPSCPSCSLKRGKPPMWQPPQRPGSRTAPRSHPAARVRAVTRRGGNPRYDRRHHAAARRPSCISPREIRPAGDRPIPGRAAGPASTFPGGAVDDLIGRRRRAPTEVSSPSSPVTRSSRQRNNEHRRHHLHGDGHPR